MAILRMFGAEQVATADLPLFIGGGGGAAIGSTGAINGNYVSVSSTNSYFKVGLLSPQTTVWGHCHIYFVSATNGALALLSVGNADYVHAALKSSGAGPCYLNAWNSTASWGDNTVGSGVLLGSGTIPLSLGVWYSLEFEFTVSATVGVIKTWINGVADLNLSGVDTYYSGAAEIVAVRIIETSGRSDNFLLGNASGTNPSSPGEIRVDCHFPESPNGTDSEWTRSEGSDNWTLVDDTAASTGTSDYIASTAVGDQTSFNVEALKVPGGTMYGAQITAYLTKQNAGPGGVKPYVLRGGTRYYGSEWFPSFGSWGFFYYVWDQDPAAGPGAWTETNYNASEFGLERTT